VQLPPAFAGVPKNPTTKTEEIKIILVLYNLIGRGYSECRQKNIGSFGRCERSQRPKLENYSVESSLGVLTRTNGDAQKDTPSMQSFEN